MLGGGVISVPCVDQVSKYIWCQAWPSCQLRKGMGGLGLPGLLAGWNRRLEPHPQHRTVKWPEQQLLRSTKTPFWIQLPLELLQLLSTKYELFPWETNTCHFLQREWKPQYFLYAPVVRSQSPSDVLFPGDFENPAHCARWWVWMQIRAHIMAVI